MKLLKLVATAFAATVLSVGVAQAEDAVRELNFSLISTESSTALKSQFEPLFKDMEKALGIKVNAYMASDYAGVIEGMRFNKVDLGWFGNKSAMEAVDRAGGEVFVQTVDLAGDPGYWSLLVAHKDSPLNKLEDVLKCDKSLTFANGDPNSTSGYLVPSYYVFAKNNVDPKACYKTITNANHETNALAVANRQVDFGTFNTEAMDRLQKTHPEMAAKLKVIWKSPLIPSDPIVWRKNLPADLKAKIKTFLLDYGVKGANAEAERKVLANLSQGWAPFRESSDAQLNPIRQLELFKSRAKVADDGSLPADEKTRKLAEIDEKLKALASN
ncbi:phosphonate ABC transporter substrate-binding protein [Telmatospirillum sp.]|uniref:phosphonate ABC transporter substrate-binding protein n=1 Tax=Telmatospirillum sp. TaxID=2079197 RepID=UPI0028441BE7|nr:phosphonate ABC transporter substrate-binding protein [Telmatospirillum sp.]MDR3440883.1 phosphonate ABC transporter substrate-binding protein [Telmatospirillum sp.]